ncbi:hypothetical protein IWX90DRAFT_249621 [Phyllosticta citrichinensis]|uniref:Protein kinase domain-containing protein n=1 Tax=Phyllosticta citrichinensis TaxID=1130410 RepID=A0ABR1XR76_9PEZI
MKSVFGDIPSEWNWYFAGHLGGGTFGTAVRYDCIDQNNVIKRRIVAKRDHFFQYTADIERAIGAKLKDRSNYILNYLIPSTRAAQGGKGITYTEFAPYGDLSSLFSMYSVAGWILPEPFCWYLLHCLAEASYVLENGEAPTSEGSSRDPSDPSGTRGWKPIFHVDLKPGNIFLKEPAENPAYWWQRNYPVPVMADFGGAARYPNDQSKRPAYFKCPPGLSGVLKGKYAYEDDTNTVDAPNHHVSGAGTHGYRSFELLDIGEQRRANEQRREANIAEGATTFAETLPEGQPIRIHTTIFQIGSILCKGMRNMAYFLNLEQLWWDHKMENLSTGKGGWVKDPQQDYQKRHQKRFPTAELRRPGKNDDGIDVEPYSPKFSLSPHYSHELVDLVFKCMHPLHDQRPTPKELWDATNKMMAEIDRIWPEPDPNIPTAATRGSEDDDDMNGPTMDYRSADEEETDEEAEERQDEVIVDPRGVELYENIREQYVDVEPTRVPKIWRNRHQEPTREAVLQLQYKQEQMHRLRQEKRDREHSENLRPIREKRAYLLGLNDYLHQAKERLRRGRNGWDTWDEAEKIKRLNLFTEQFRRSRKKAGETVFSDRDVDGFDVEDPDPEPPPTPEERSEDELEFQGHPDFVPGQTSGGVAESNGRLIRRGPRMVALQWDFQPLGAQMLVGDQYAIYRRPIFAPRDYGDMDSDESVASVTDLN